jgi:serine/threonine protein kinase
LDSKIEENKKEKKVFGYIQILFYLDQILKGVGYLHEQQIVHRDLKPK